MKALARMASVAGAVDAAIWFVRAGAFGANFLVVGPAPK